MGAATTRFLSAGSQEIAEYTGSGTGTLARRYVYGPGLDEPLATVTGDGAGRARAFHHADGLGSVVALTNAAGAVTERHAYTPFGVGDSTAGSPWQFAGRRLDVETGLYYQRARHYSPTLGRFLQMDPIGTNGGINLYAYVTNDPLNFTDPYGLFALGGVAATLQGKASGGYGLTQQTQAMGLCVLGPGGCLVGAGVTAGQLILGGAAVVGTGAIILNNQNQDDQTTSAPTPVTPRPDLPPMSGGRSGQNVPGLTGPPNSAIPGGSGNRIFITDENGNVVADVTRDRAKPVIPGQGFGPKRAPTPQEIDLLDKLGR